MGVLFLDKSKDTWYNTLEMAILSQNPDLALAGSPLGGFDGGCVSAEGVPEKDIFVREIRQRREP